LTLQPKEDFLMQWNALLFTEQPANLWISWIEAQGRWAPAIQYPELELSRDRIVTGDSPYTNAARRFLAGHLNTSYAELEADQGNKYDAALYWRFLYEQYGDVEIVRAALEEMTRHFNPNTVDAMKRAMHAAFARVDGLFGSFEDSLIAFARANYALRLEVGRCTSAAPEKYGHRYYDPEEMYAALR
jgi:hypothetical protein